MFVSVIIPTYKRKKDLERALDSLCRQTYLPQETIIVDQSPDKETEKLCMQNEYNKIGMRYFWRDDTSSARARNQGIEELNKKSDVVCFFDDDVEIDHRYIEKVIGFLDTQKQSLGGGGQEICKSIQKGIGYRMFDAPWIKGFTMTLDAQKKSPTMLQHITGMAGCTMFLRKKVLDTGYRFPHRMDRYSFEDIFLSYQVYRDHPGSLYYLPSAKIIHHESPVARMHRDQHLRQKISHMFYFYCVFDISLVRFFWWVLGYSLHLCINSCGGLMVFKILIFLVRNKQSLLRNPSLLNAFIFG